MTGSLLLAAAAGRSLCAVHLDGRPNKGAVVKKSLGMLLLGAWLILTGLISLAHLSFNGLSLIMAVLALGAGLLLIAGK